jgi:hypothetical protein
MSHDPIHADVELMDDPEAGSTWFFSLVSIVLMAVTVLALVAMYFGFAQAEVETKVVDRPVRELEKLKLSQLETLTSYGTYEVETADGDTVKRIRIPISQAMELVLADQKSRADAGVSEEAVASR